MLDAGTAAAVALSAAAFAGFGAALLQRDLLRALLAFGAGSAAFAGVLALLGAPLVAAVELTAGAGLVAVLLLVATTLAPRTDKAGRAGGWTVVAALSASSFVLAALLVARAAPPDTGATAGWVGDWLWQARGVDVAAQALLLFASVLGVLATLRREAPA